MTGKRGLHAPGALERQCLHYRVGTETLGTPCERHCLLAKAASICPYPPCPANEGRAEPGALKANGQRGNIPMKKLGKT